MDCAALLVGPKVVINNRSTERVHPYTSTECVYR
jgi:hypothetical protein